MPAVYAAADVLVLPSECETWGLVCNEALACGTPVVVSDAVGCAPDLAADGRAGRSFPLGDCAACAQSLIDLFNDPPAREELEQVSARYSLMKAADGVNAAVSSVVTMDGRS
jgi:glycosyltransferase involved in cell wall biosynthesis